MRNTRKRLLAYEEHTVWAEADVRCKCSGINLADQFRVFVSDMPQVIMKPTLTSIKSFYDLTILGTFHVGEGGWVRGLGRSARGVGGSWRDHDTLF